MENDLGCLYVVVAKKLLHRTDIVTPPSGCAADKWQLRVIFPRTPGAPATSKPRGIAEGISLNPNITAKRSRPGGEADIECRQVSGPGIAIFGSVIIVVPLCRCLTAYEVITEPVTGKTFRNRANR